MMRFSAAHRSRPHRKIAIAVLGVASIGYATAVFTMQPLLAFPLAFAVAALVSAFSSSKWTSWFAGVSLFTASLTWMLGAGIADAARLALLIAPACISMYAVVHYVQGSEGDETGELPSNRWSRALILTVVAFAVAGLALGAVTLGQRSTRVARHARTNDELSISAAAMAAQLESQPSPGGAGIAAAWPGLLEEAAMLSARSVYLFAPDDEGHHLIVGARWSASGDSTVAAVFAESQVPDAEIGALRHYLRDPFVYANGNRTWVLPVGGIPYGRTVFDDQSAPRESTESRKIHTGSSTGEFRRKYVLVLSPPAATEWWSVETRTEYTRIVFMFVVWALVIGLGLIALIMRLADERMELRTQLAAGEAREAIRRDAHDRIYNRLAAVAHGLERPGADEITARGAAFEIRSTVEYLQTILREGDSQQSALKPVRVVPQLNDLVESAERIWNLKVRLEIEGEVLLAPGLAWDVQCLIDEALSNSGEHSGASEAVVRISQSDDTVRFSVTDNGAWEPKKPGSESTGLAGMTSRVRLLDGILSVSPGDEGTTVSVELPLQ